MRILHTSDWHLGDRLKQIDRTADLERAVERVAAYCRQQQVDVLLIAGDLLSELAQPQSLQSSIAHLSQTFRPFLLRGGTIIALAGNHDNDIYCEMLRRAFQLAAPNTARPGDLLPTGRFYLAVQPVHFQLLDRDRRVVQFVCLPYPTMARYLSHGSARGFKSFRERCEQLQEAFLQRLQQLRAQLDPRQPKVLAAHVTVAAERPTCLFRTEMDEEILLDDLALLHDFSYVALGHLHGPGSVSGLQHVWYSGSIERLSMAEREQEKGVVVVDIPGNRDLIAPRFLPLPATPFYDIVIANPGRDLPELARRFPHAATALARCHIRYRPSKDNLYDILAYLSRLFPRCYQRTWNVAAEPSRHRPDEPNTRSGLGVHDEQGRPDGDSVTARVIDPTSSWQISDDVPAMVLAYLANALRGDGDHDALISLARQLLEEAD